MGRTSRLAATCLLAASATATLRGPIPIHRRQTAGTTHDNLTRPSLDIDWQPCYENTVERLECTWLTVPLDYENPDVGTTDIAFIRYLFSENAEDLYYNPGGPGGSGIETVLNAGKTWGDQWGMNIVSFDPRSVGKSGPKISCDSPSSGNETATLKRRRDSTIAGDLKGAWDSSLESNTKCNENNKNTEMKYVGTAAVVQDMMHFVERTAASKGKDPASAHINYFGTSYGTGVGQTLVAMYPHRIRRALLDGNLYAVAHYQGWEPSGVDDFAHGIWLFSQLCFKAGPEWCPLAEGLKSIDEVHAAFDAVVLSLRATPIDCGNSSAPYDHNSFLAEISQFMYGATSMGQISNKTTSYALALADGDTSQVCASAAETRKIKKREEAPASGDDHVRIITAVDIAGRYPFKTYEEFKAAAERLEETAPYGAFQYATGNGLVGLGFDDIIPPPSQYFTGFENGTTYETPFPVLFVNTPGDPVTPMSSAYQMSKLFIGSSVFILNIPGHGYQGARSKCAEDIVATYFANGTVPKSGTWCEADVATEFYFGAEDPGAPKTS